VHDFNPGVTQNGLFWTSIASAAAVHINLDAGSAIVNVRNLHMKDYVDLENATVGNGPKPVPSVVSYRVEWNAVGAINAFDNPAQLFRGDFLNAVARMEWAARPVDFEFVSAPIATSTTDAAQLGHERNGAFY
jgi:hypothetical protein